MSSATLRLTKLDFYLRGDIKQLIGVHIRYKFPIFVIFLSYKAVNLDQFHSRNMLLWIDWVKLRASSQHMLLN